MTSYSTITPLGLSGPCQAKVTLSLLRLSFSTTLTAVQEKKNKVKKPKQQKKHQQGSQLQEKEKEETPF